MEAKVVRQKFLAFFESKGHKVVSSAPIVVQNDPSLMFTNAGMNQFKDFFLGNKPAEFSRIADTQKCLRVSGKHNDLEEVGFDTYHHTMFEMLGNWSFGDYFKKEAISWAWELLTEVYGLPEDRMYATIFEGDDSESLDRDNEAKDIWKQFLPEERILNGNKKDNFWEMGETGPCGPCSEVHIDLRPQADREKIAGATLVNQDDPLVIEVWNLVFIQFNRMADGSLKNLPQKHVDTGMGFERLTMAIQGKQSNYDSDVFTPMIQLIAYKAGVKYGSDDKTNVAIRVIADHIRAISFTIADGQLPSNAKAGYVIRRILRRAVRYGYTFLGFEEPTLHSLVDLLAGQFKDVFPELEAQKDFVAKVIKEEEASFLRTLEKGLKRFEVIKSEATDKIVDGAIAFELYDTYGFPLDLTSLIAKENGLEVDEVGFKVQMAKQKERSKSAAQKSAGDWIELDQDAALSDFLGYDQVSSEAKITKYREVNQNGKIFYQLVLDRTPFYAESGGQVGDIGYFDFGTEKLEIFDTKKENDLIVHYTKKLPTDLNLSFQAVVNVKKRRLTENNHSATHLLHAALREVLGDHVQQKGSLVNEKILRFDFSHFSKVTDEQIQEVERIVNEKVRENIKLGERRNVPIEEAKTLGAMALFGEKYGDFVRVITFDQKYSVELCGGTHVSATGVIGQFKVMSESSVAAGVRRIEAITAERAEAFVNTELALLTEVKELLKNPKDPLKAIQGLLDDKAQLQKDLESINQEKAKGLKQELAKAAVNVGDCNVILQEVSLPNAEVLKQLSFELKNEMIGLVLILAANLEGKPMLSVMIDEKVIHSQGLNASDLVRAMSKEIKGGGGGQPFYATAGGKDVSGLSRALDVAKSVIEEKLNTKI